MNPVAQLVRINDKDDRYYGLMIWCPGCEYVAEDDRKVGGLHMLPINGNRKKHPVWDWNKDLVNVTLNPSILTKLKRGNIEFRCHSFLRNAQWQFLGDCTHRLKNQIVPMVELPDWVVR